MSENLYNDLQPGDERAYKALALAFQTNVLKLAAPFRAAGNAEALSKMIGTGGFIGKFLERADRSSKLCCCECAKIMRQSTVVPEVRGITTIALADEIRKQVFSPQDGLIESLKQLRERMENTALQLRGNCSMKPSTYSQGLLLLRHGNEFFIKTISEYLAEMTELIEPLLDYCCARSFADQVSLVRQQQAVQDVKCEIARELEPIIKLIVAASEAQQYIGGRTLPATHPQKLDKQKQFELEFRKREPGVGGVSLAVSVGLAFWAFHSCNTITSSEDEGAMFWLAILACGAILSFVFGIIKFFDRTPKPLANNASTTTEAGQKNATNPRRVK